MSKKRGVDDPPPGTGIINPDCGAPPFQRSGNIRIFPKNLPPNTISISEDGVKWVVPENFNTIYPQYIVLGDNSYMRFRLGGRDYRDYISITAAHIKMVQREHKQRKTK